MKIELDKVQLKRWEIIAATILLLSFVLSRV